ncbi:hypothetical protein [Turneriella parva]|uniref:Uncharacterized protein n=1 Tax=Turneriella parva (strain ATCC BAA-1111 / DSM 21527 / NCTC 11395 / H) TaxID=869212 RepID=I4B387_TURPD|nr:hypothetical protein [Turneriella parva]AFM11744.1 hypothetical protein Turpa_1096 [Turneriella parva DSM 21527]
MRIFNQRRFLRSGIVSWLMIIGLLGSCARSRKVTEFRKKQAADAGVVYTPTQWVQAIGEQKANYLLTHNGRELNQLTSGAGVSNIVELLKAISDVTRIGALIGNDYENSGLGVARLLRLMVRVDDFMAEVRFDGEEPRDYDTIADLAAIVNGLSDVAAVNDKIVALFNAMEVTRTMIDGNNGENDERKIDKVAILIAHLDPVSTLHLLINEMSADAVKGNLAHILLGVNSPNHLVDVVENIASAGSGNYRRLVYILNNINTSAADILARLINDVYLMRSPSHASRAKLYALVNLIESGLDWSEANMAVNQPGGIQNFNIEFSTPHGPDSGMARLVALLNEAGGDSADTAVEASKLAWLINNLPEGDGTIKLVRLLQDMDRITDLTNAEDNGLLELLTNPATDSTGIKNLTNLVETIPLADFRRLRIFVNGVQGNGLGGTLSDQSDFRSQVAEVLKQVPNSHINRVLTILQTLSPADGILNLIRVLKDSSVPKLVPLICDVQTERLTYLIETVPNPIKLTQLINRFHILKMNLVVLLINGVTGSHNIDTAAGQRSGATGLGKLVNLIEYASSREDIADAINELSSAEHITRLLEIINPHANSTNLVCLFSELTSVSYASGADLGLVIAGLDDESYDPRKLRLILTHITQCGGAQETLTGLTNIPSDFTLLAQLMGTQSTHTQGVGHAAVAQLIKSLQEEPNLEATAERLARVLKGVNAEVTYVPAIEGRISKREAFVRLLNTTVGSGIVYSDESVGPIAFPGLGPIHLATMINKAADPIPPQVLDSLTILLNDNDLMEKLAFVGCIDRVGDPDPFVAGHVQSPDFYTPCAAMGAAEKWLP